MRQGISNLNCKPDSLIDKSRCRCTRHSVLCLLLVAACWLLPAQPARALDLFGWWGSGDADAPAASAPPPRQPQPIDQPHAVADLAYGDVLFEYYQQHYFSAITQVMVARERGLLDANNEHAQLVLGALYVSYGLLDQGEAIFRELLADYSSAAGADEAWYQLARIHYQRGHAAHALEILESRIQQPREARPAEYLLLQILCQVRLGNVDQAQALTPYLKLDPAESLLVRFNMGTALTQLGQPRRAADIFSDILAEYQNPQNEVDKTLLDRSALALGIHYLRNDQLQLARQTLEQIRLYGPVANRGLLALGWTHFRSQRQQDALTPWLELNERSLTDPAVQESLLNVPYVFEQLGALQDALDGYQSAYQIFLNQRRRLESVKQDIKRPDWIERISPVDLSGQGVMDAPPPFELPATDPSSEHLYRYFASNEFQRLYQDYRELQRLYMVLTHWERQFPSFYEMINTHVPRLDELAPQSEQAVDQARSFYAYSRVKLDEFESRLSEIVANDDLMGLANAEQINQKARLDALEARLQALGDRDQYWEEWEKLELLQGLLMWDLNATAVDKRWEASKQQTTLNNLLLEMETRIRALSAARENGLNRFYGFETRIQNLREKLTALKSDTGRQLRQQRARMQATASAIVDNQQQQLDGMRAKALLSIARLQDRGYMQERERQQAQEQGLNLELDSNGPAPATGGQPPAQTLQEVIQRIFTED